MSTDKVVSVIGDAEKDGNIHSDVEQVSSNHDLEHHGIRLIVSPSARVDYKGDGDQALQFVLEVGEDLGEYDPVRDRKLLWKIDFALMPVMCLLYCFQYMDKLSNSYASILGLRTDLKMVGNQYSWTGSAFYLGYLFFEYPSVRLLQRFPVAKTVAVFIVIWGVILSLHAVPQYAGFIALRTILGMFELAVTPAFVIITGQYYRKEEVFLRTAFWFASNGVGAILGGSIAYGLISEHGHFSIAAWKLVFVITGVLTVALGIFVFFYIPDTPATAWFLNDQEKKDVVLRIRKNQQGFGNKTFKLDQFKEAFKDLNTWLMVLFALSGNIPNGGITNFGSILLNQKLKFSVKDSLLFQMPGGGVEFFGCIGLAFISQYFNSRLPMAIFASAIGIVGVSILAFSENKIAQLVGYSVQFTAPLGLIGILSCISSNVAGHTKKTTVNALLLIAYCVGNLIGPQTFRPEEAPEYHTATASIVGLSFVSWFLLISLYISYKYRNRQRERAEVDTTEFDKIENFEFADLTDFQNPHFRYAT